MFAAIGRSVIRRPWWVITCWIVAAGGLVLVAPSLSSVTTSDQSSFLPRGAESVRAADLAARAFPDASGSTALIVVNRADHARLSAADLAAVQGLAGTLDAHRPPAVRAVLFDPQQTVASNGRVATVAVRLAGDPQSDPVTTAVGDLRTGTRQALRGSGLNAGVTGNAAIVLDNRTSMAHAEKIVAVATVVLIVVLLLLIFRGPLAALLPLLTVGLVYGVSTSLVAVAARLFDFHVGQEVPTMMIVVLFGIGTDYLLFLLFRYRERLRAGDDPREAILAAVERVGEAIFSAGFAVIAAFGALVLATLGFFTTLGPALAISVAIMVMAALTLLPAVVAVLGRRIFWPSRSADRPPRRSHFAGVGRFVARRPAVVVVVTAVLLLGLGAGATAFKASYDPISQLPAGTEASRAFTELQRGFPAGALAPTEVYLHRDVPFTPAEISAYVGRLATAPGVATPDRPVVSTDGRTVDVPVLLRTAPYDAGSLTLVAGPLRDAARSSAPQGAQVLVGGQTMAFADVRRTTDRDLRLIFPVAALLFLLILAGMLRAALAPIYLVAIVAGGFAATLGAAVLVFQVAAGHAGLHFAMPIILYLFVTAIGTDYNILVTARLREEIREGRSVRQATALAIEHAGPSVAAAAVILAGTFGSLVISGVPFFLEIGFGVTVGIMLVAFVISLLLVPAVTALAGRMAWWPGNRGASGSELDAPTDREPALTR